MSVRYLNPGGGVRDHGALLGLADDDHLQYHTDARGDARYAQRTNNLSDLSSAATARTNLGLSAGGAGDIWVQLTGDTMTGPLQVDVATATQRGLILRSTDNSGVTPIFEAQNTAGTAIISMRTAVTGGSSTINFLNITGTLNSSPTGSQNGIAIAITGAGSAAQIQRAIQANIIGGYTGPSHTSTATFVNASQGTDVTFGSGNVAVVGSMVATTVGWNHGITTTAAGGDRNYGALLRAISGKVNATNVGVLGLGSNTASGATQIAGYFAIASTDPGNYESAALIADNVASTSPIALFRDNGTKVVTIADGGAVLINQTAIAGTREVPLRIQVSDNATNFFRLANGGSTDGGFQPTFEGYRGDSNAAPALSFYGNTDTTYDTGSAPIMSFDVFRTTAGNPDAGFVEIATRPAFRFRNWATNLVLISATGNVLITPSAVGTSGLTVRNFAAQTANSTEWQTSGSVAYVSVGPDVLPNDGSKNWFRVAGTLPSGPSAAVIGADFSITGAGTTAQDQMAFRVVMNAGYTGTARTIGGSLQNLSAGGGANLSIGTAGTPTGNLGFAGLVVSTTTGYNVGMYGEARSGNLNIGVMGKTVTAKNSATNIAVLGNALNTGSTPIQIGGYFSLDSGTPTFESAALIADNGAQTSPIFLARDNGTTVFSVADGGLTFVDSASQSAFIVKSGANITLQVNASARVVAVNTGVGNQIGALTITPSATSQRGLVVIAFSGSQSANLMEIYGTGGGVVLSVTPAGHLTFGNAIDIVMGTGTGTKIGTATSQKLAFWNATPIIQPTTAVAAATFVANSSGIADDSATFDGYTIGQVVKALRNAGLLA